MNILTLHTFTKHLELFCANALFTKRILIILCKLKKNPQPIMHGNIIEVPSGNAMEKACICFIMAYKFYHIVLFYYQILT